MSNLFHIIVPIILLHSHLWFNMDHGNKYYQEQRVSAD